MSTNERRQGVPAPKPFEVSYPPALPIVAKREEIVNALRSNQVVIISGETGSGKTTQIPKMCVEAGIGNHGKIACTQPRRIAALSVSRRLAQELGVTWGHEVGCKIRFTDHTRRETRIKVMTDGILLAEIRSDPELRAYEAIILDEAHERSLNIDFLLGYIKQLLVRRPDLKVVITSATIDTELFSKAFNDAPVFEVSGRLFPVDIHYRPLSSFEDDEEISHVQGAAEAVRAVIAESLEGDVLVFMPTERDIRETCELIRDTNGKNVDVLPLMGSLSSSEQERVFAPTSKRKVIVSTNIAETSLTIPGIRFVIDSGLARISRYNPRQRVRRLPVERIAQSNANQRSGRAGRIEAGVCVRLYEREDFESRPPFAEPEILRANLAEVILRMKAFNLGDIETFPFLNPPDSRAIRGGFALLHELGAIEQSGEVSRIGMELAKLPVDPTIGRMLLQARRERCLPEMIVIAAALSIQDPRERSAENRQKADQAHRVFVHPDSDFLTLVKLWSECAREMGQNRSKSALRKFCKVNFLSFVKMREWGDLISELAREMSVDVSAISDPSTIERFDGRYRAIHRSILSGFLGQVAYRLSANSYRGATGRELSMWPGSVLSERSRVSSEKTQPERKRRTSQQQWIVSSEIVETSRVFARNNARVVVSWIEEIARHLIKRGFVEPRWCAERLAVIAEERISLYGLLLSSRRVLYGLHNPEEAREIFIQSALLTPDESSDRPWIVGNGAVANKVAMVLASQGRLNRVELEERLAQFYRERLPLVSSVEELDRFVKHKLANNPTKLQVSFEYLTNGADFSNIDEQFPDAIAVAGENIRVWYAYEPGATSDGVTLELPPSLIKGMAPELLDGVIPGLREKQVLHLLHDLPKDIRKRLGSLPEAAEKIARHTTMTKLPLVRAVRDILREEFAVDVPDEALDIAALPSHLRPRVTVREAYEEGRNPRQAARSDSEKEELASAESSSEQGLWTKARATWEREDVSSWDFGDPPESVQVGMLTGVAILLYPTLRPEGEQIALRLADTRDDAIRDASRGMRALAERVLSKEVSDLRKQSKDIEKIRPLLLLWTTPDDFKKSLLECAFKYLFERPIAYPLTRSAFEELLESARGRAPNLIPTILDTTRSILELRKTLLAVKRPYSGMRSDVDELIPPDLLAVTPYEHLRHLPRYLRTMILRCERMDTNPARYEQCVRQLRAYEDRLPTLPSEQRTELRWMLEELKVSFFAQELGTQYPISPKRIDVWLGQLAQ
ncbi:MAG: ATP-dependent helicase HrpA [Pseudomonadota bacterium]